MRKFIGYLLLVYAISILGVWGLFTLDMKYGTTTREQVCSCKEETTLYIQTKVGEVFVKLPLKVREKPCVIEVRRSWSGLITQSKVVE